MHDDLRASGCSPRRRSAAAEILTLERRELLTGATVGYQVTQDWGSGFQGTISFRNGDQALSGWTLEFNFAGNISSLWNARIVSHVGNRYVVADAGWNASVAPGGAASFGFVASPGGGAVASPSGFRLNGSPTNGGGSPTPPSLSIADVSTTEGNSGTTSALFRVTLSRAATGPITVDYATSDGTAAAGSDYVPVSGRLTFAAGETSKTIAVAVKGDGNFEPDETFAVTLSNPSGATLARAKAVGTVVNDDAAPATPGVSYAVASDWGSGFSGQVTFTNPSTTKALSGWTLEFNFAGNISSLWNARIVSHVGSRYVVADAGWNASVAPGGAASFGFVASPGGGAVASPANFSLNGTALGGGGATNAGPKAVGDSAVSYGGRAVKIAVLANDSDPDGDALSIASIQAPAHGTAVAAADGTITYTPQAGYVGADSFTYTIADGRGGKATATVAVTNLADSQGQWPSQFYAPYVDVALYPTYNLAAAAQASGVKRFALAFITADPQARPAWGGYASYAINGGEFDTAMRAQVDAVRALGGDVLVSFGGASNRELAEVIPDVAKLKAAYRSVIDAYNLTAVDFDIEGAATADRASVDRRSAALAALQRELAAEGRSLEVWLTLPVLPTGLTGDGLYVVQSAVKAGVNLSGVNIMTMDYGGSAAPNPAGKMGDYAIQAGESLFAQLRGVYGAAKTDAQLWAMVGLTPMIGMNDVQTEVLDQAEAREVVAWAKAKSIGRLSIWSLNRDRSNAAGPIGYVEPTSSSIRQDPFEFSLIFLAFEDNK